MYFNTFEILKTHIAQYFLRLLFRKLHLVCLGRVSVCVGVCLCPCIGLSVCISLCVCGWVGVEVCVRV